MMLHKVLKNLSKRLFKSMLTQYFVKVSPGCDLQALGSSYGSWTIDVSRDLSEMLLISGGLGEDSSFDLEFISRFGSRVILVDPTDRAERHFSSILKRLGSPATAVYSEDGNQPVSAYDLSKVSQNQLIFIKKAIWKSRCQLKLYPPKDPSHVSFGLKRSGRGARGASDFLLVDAVSVQLLMQDLEIQGNFILKLDIEGAEVAALHSLLGSGIRPHQILVEYEFLAIRNLHRIWEVIRLHKRLCSLGYEMLFLHLGKNATYRQIQIFKK